MHFLIRSLVWLSPFFDGVLSAAFHLPSAEKRLHSIASSDQLNHFNYDKVSPRLKFLLHRNTGRKLLRVFLNTEWEELESGSEWGPGSGPESKSKEWSIADDWSSLSSLTSGNTIPDSESLYNSDVVGVAARAMEQDLSSSHWESSEENDDDDDTLLQETVDYIYRNTHDPADPSLYDTAKSLESTLNTIDFLDKAGREVSLLVRCNESPEEMLIQEGRALPPLQDDEKYDASQLLKVFDNHEREDKNSKRFETTAFFDGAISKIFNEHAVFVTSKTSDGTESRASTKDDKELALDRGSIARWMSKSLGDDSDVVGKHDKRVTTVISRYGTYGTGYLTQSEFRKLYIDAVLSGWEDMEKKRKSKATWKMTNNNMKKLKLKQPTIESVWRDFRNHDILSPAEEERKKLEIEINKKHGGTFNSRNNAGNTRVLDTLMDECEILEWGDHDHSDPRSSSSNSKGSNTRTAKEEGNSNKRKSSYEFVELASDNKTPKRIRDGSFVFIDEETCIGCTQCAQIAPSSFVMLDSGRARTFSQSSAPENDVAISACPVSCMHKVAFHELKEMESSRDHGDGRTDHRHLGYSKRHTPLNVARIDSDANHKSSWYHYLKQKCYISSSCPRRGCYDCPMYSAPGENPYFKKLHRAAEKTRAKDLIDSGEADMYRNAVDL